MSNVNSDQIYQYKKHQTTYTFRTHDQYRSWNLIKVHRQKAYNQIQCKIPLMMIKVILSYVNQRFHWKFKGDTLKSLLSPRKDVIAMRTSMLIYFIIMHDEYWRAATLRCCAHKWIDFAKRTSTNCLHNHIALLAQSDVDGQ